MNQLSRRLSLIPVAAAISSLAFFSSSPLVMADKESSDNIDIYILVDESSSLSQGDIDLERKAVEDSVGLSSILKRNIRVGVIPFSSGVGSPRKLGRCELIAIDDSNSELLKECAKKIKRQFNEQGNTDFASAFNSIADRVKQSADKDRIPVIILLTDGIYDPDGDQESSTTEKDNLNSALDRLKEAKVPIWALGFGLANLEALSLYSEVTRQENGNCNAQSNARLVEKEALAIQMQVIVGEATCSDITPKSVPSTRFIHPLIDEVSVTYFVKDNIIPTLTAPKNKVPCLDNFREISKNVYQCTVETDGTDVGLWVADAGKGATVVWEIGGTVLLKVDSCPKPTNLLMSRLDGKVIDFKSAQLWPQVEITIDKKFYNVVTADSSEVLLTSGSGQIPVSGILEVSGKKGQNSDGLPIMKIVPSKCDLGTEPPPETTVPPTTTTTNPPPTCEELGNCPPLRWPWLLLAISVMAGAFIFRIWRRSLRFPMGTVVAQQSPANLKAWIDPAGELGSEIGGLTKVALSVDRNSKKVSIDEYGAACDYVISVSGDQIAIESVLLDDEIGDEGSSKKQKKNSKEPRFVPFGLPFVLEPSVIIRIERPDDTSEEDLS